MAGHILIAGPTASGKSALALAIAARTGAAIVNADSMQVYRDLRVLTARPSVADEALAAHRLYGVLDGAERCSAGIYAQHAQAVLEALADEERQAIFVGGTGLYFRALTEGLSAIPAIGAEAKAAVANYEADAGPEGLHAVLARYDPDAAAGLRPSDRQRILRALEVFTETGESLLQWQSRPGTPVLPEAAAKVVLTADRAWLHRRAERRFTQMIDEGAMEEVAALTVRGLDPSLPVMKAVGVPELSAVQAGTRPLDQAIADAQTATRRFIKRQETWFRNQMGDWPRADAQDPDGALDMVMNRWEGQE